MHVNADSWVVGNNAQLYVDLSNINNYNLTLNNNTWLVGGPPNIWCNNSWHTTLDYSISPITNITKISGSSNTNIGDYTGLTQTFSIKGCNGYNNQSSNTLLILSILYYNSVDLIEFKQSFPNGLLNTNITQIMEHSNSGIYTPMIPITEYPVFEYNSLSSNFLSNNLRYMEWQGRFLLDRFNFGIGLKDFEGGLEGGPLLFYHFNDINNDKQAANGLVLSSMNNFMNGIFSIRTRRGLNNNYVTLYDNIDFEGNDLKLIANVPTVEDCADYCKNAFKYCNAFSWIANDTSNGGFANDCFLKYNNRGMTAANNHFSGVLGTNDNNELNYLVAGVQGNITNIPQDYSISFVIAAQSSSNMNENSKNIKNKKNIKKSKFFHKNTTKTKHAAQNGKNVGIRGIIKNWGDIMQQLYNTNKISNDLIVDYLGYWTDNGGYYYGSKPLTTKIAIDLFKHFVENEIPVRYLQLDPYWFDGGSNGKILKWEARKDLFPDNGLFTLHDNLTSIIQSSNFSNYFDTIPLLLYSFFWSPGPNGTQQYYSEHYDLDIDFMNSISFDAGFLQGIIAQPIGYKNGYEFYKFLLNKYKNISYGFEVDFMDFSFEEFPYGINGYYNYNNNELNLNLNLTSQWTQAMNDANLLFNNSIQYCMTLAVYLLDSLRYNGVTNARASEDDFPTNPSRWMIGYSGLFMSALNIQPFFDVFWTTSIQNGNKYNSNSHDCEMQAIISLLGNGPLGIGDNINMTNKTIINRLVRKDGLLLHPSKTITPIDAMFKLNTTNTETNQIWQTYTTISSSSNDSMSSSISDINSISSYIVLAIDYTINGGYQFTFDDLYPVPDDSDQFIVFTFDPSNKDSINKGGPCQNNTNIFEGCPAGSISLFNSSDVFDVLTDNPPVSSDTRWHAWNLYNMIKIESNGWALLGDMMRYVPVSSKRFNGLAVMDGNVKGLEVNVDGSPNEAIVVSFMTGDMNLVQIPVQFDQYGTIQRISINDLMLKQL